MSKVSSGLDRVGHDDGGRTHYEDKENSVK